MDPEVKQRTAEDILRHFYGYRDLGDLWGFVNALRKHHQKLLDLAEVVEDGEVTPPDAVTIRNIAQELKTILDGGN